MATAFIFHGTEGYPEENWFPWLKAKLEQLQSPIKAAFLTGAPIGVRPILNYDRDNAFSGFDFDWDTIKQNCKYFEVFQSNDDLYVSLGNGEELAKNLGVKLNFIPNAGHFNAAAGYLEFPQLLKKIRTSL